MKDRSPPASLVSRDASPTPPKGAMRPQKPLTLRAILAYGRCESLTGGLVCFSVIFGPWAFGTTEPWSVWVLNSASFLLGLLLLAKMLIRRLAHYQPAAWDRNHLGEGMSRPDSGMQFPRWIGATLATLTLAILGYCLIAALNARALYSPARMDFTYLSHIEWLPHSYDRDRTLLSTANFLALALFFWSLRDWLMGKTADETRTARPAATARERGDSVSPVQPRTRIHPGRLRFLLWLLCINGTLLAVESICQKLSGTTKLLWLVQPRINADPFGPYSYHSNGAQFFNLLWPVALGFWWTLRREVRYQRSIADRRRAWRSHLLLPGVLLMAICPILSSSRAGAAVAIAAIGLSAVIILLGLKRRHPATRFAALLFFGATLATGLLLGWDKLADRLKDTRNGYVVREDIYVTAREVARDYPWFGTGPGTFESVFQLYRRSPDEYWPAQLHNDWLETRITFGWVGSALIALAFFCVLARWFVPGEIHGSLQFTALLWLALAGCLAHARFDFPFQVYSILQLFLLECAILSVISKHRGGIATPAT